MNASFCKVRSTVPHSIWHFRSKNRYAIFQRNEYHLDSLLIVHYARSTQCVAVNCEVPVTLYSVGIRAEKACL